jgi:diguanylate cyclase (GGDEF)-like protein
MLKDATTGIYARSALKERLLEEVAHARTSGEPLSLLLIDLDYFKSVNDAFGHSRGDAVLMEWVERLGTAIRSTDLPFRYGGDEFVVLLPSTPAEHASALAHRLLVGTRRDPFGDDPPLTLTLSIGAASFPDDANTPDGLFAVADHRLYAAKRQGRGRVVDAPVAALDRSPLDETARLVEREGALQEVHRFLGELPERGRSVLYVEGTRGSGRSRLLAEARRAAELLGYETLLLAGRPAHRGHAYATLQEAVTGIEALAVMVAAESVLFSPAGDGGVDRPLLVLLDDAVEADRATLDLLRRTLAVEGPRPLGLICGVESTRRFQAPRFDIPSPAAVELRPLTLDASRIWARELLRWEAPQAFLAWLHGETGGLPRALHAGLLHLQERGLLVRQGDRWSLRPQYSDLPLREMLGGGEEAPGHNLPAGTTTFVGRAREIEAVRALLGRSRLLTLAGPGGIGKTRLAVELAREVLDYYPDGICLVELAPVADPARVPAAVAAALGLSEEPGRPHLETLAAHLRHRLFLLILDNCEHVIESTAALTAELLNSCGHLTVLATSRETLGLPCEQTFRVPPLSLPGPDDLPDARRNPAELAGRFEAISLFRQRAALVDPGFEITAANLDLAAEICRQLDGIPLAIELAAARTGLLSLEQIAARLSDRFRLLRGGTRGVLPRQQTLKALVDWSYELLAEEERALLRALSVFSGGHTLEAAEEVFGADILDLLSRLVNKSLVQTDRPAGEGEPRYQMLDTIRQYAWDRLIEAGEAGRYRACHLEYYLRLAEEAEGGLLGPEQRGWLERLTAEHGNLRAALDWASSERPEAGLRLAAAVTRYWLVRGHRSEGRERLSSLLDTVRRREADAAGTEIRPLLQRARFALGLLALYQYDSREAVRHGEAAAQLAEALGDDPARAVALSQLGYARHQSGDPAGGAAAWEAGLALARRLGEPWPLGFALRGWAYHLQRLGRSAEADRALAEALPLLRRTGDDWLIANVVWRWGVTRLWRLGDPDGAVPLFREAHAQLRALGDRVGIAHTLSDMGWALYFQGHRGEARRLFEEALIVSRERTDGPGFPDALYNLGKLAQLEGQYEEAAEYLRELLQLEPGDYAAARMIPWALQTLAWIDLKEGREERAVLRLRDALQRFREQGEPLGAGVCLRTFARLRLRSAPDTAVALIGCGTAVIERAGWESARLMYPVDPEDLAFLRTTLGEPGYTAAFLLGRGLTLEEATAVTEQSLRLPGELSRR